MLRKLFSRGSSRPRLAAAQHADSPPRIPNILHFCFGFSPQAEFGFLEYLAIKSAFELNRPERVLLHYQHPCSGPWWERVQEIVTLNQIQAPTEIFGRPLQHFAHRCDVLRLKVLLEHGGIYLDIDTLCVRPFTELRTHECVMGRQPRWRGLCNAVILSEPRGVFLTAWLDQFRSFRSRGHDRYWDEHSVRIPARLARKRHLRNHITVLNERTFFFPRWNAMQHLFESNDATMFEESYCIHYWESLTRKSWLSKITPDSALAQDSNFARFVRRALGTGRVN